MDDESVHCYNCGYHNSILNYIIDSEGSSFKEIMKEIRECDTLVFRESKQEQEAPIVPDLPKDVIDLYDKTQLNFYKNNDIVNGAISYLRGRGILTAGNRPTKMFMSLNDFTHKNRIIIPHYSVNGTVDYYQSRAFCPESNYPEIRYLSKAGGDKILFNLDKITDDSKYIFLCEGAFNACFIKNGVACGGITLSEKTFLSDRQEESLRAFPTHELIVILDNQEIDNTAKIKTEALRKMGYRVFQWPARLAKFKDTNDLAKYMGVNLLPEELFVKLSR